jgi:hypothetical protein
MVTDLVGRFRSTTSGISFDRSLTRKGNNRPSQRSGSGFTLAVEILERVGDQSILAQCDHRVVRSENEVWQEAAVHRLHSANLGKRRLSLVERTMIGLVLAEIIREVGALVLDVESGLADGVEPDHQFSQARRASHEDDFAVG